MNKKTNNSNNPTSGKKKWVQPIWFPEEPKKEDVSPTSRTQERPFSEKNIKHKWQVMNQYEKKLKEMLDELRDSFKGVEKEMNDVGADYYLYDRIDFMKKNESDGSTDIRAEDLETLRTLMIQMLLFNQQILYNDSGKVINRRQKSQRIQS